MPVTFRYVESESPPAPYVLVSLGCLAGTTFLADVPAKVDSGADRTVIPTQLATQLKLDEIERRIFEGLGGQRVALAIFRVVLAIRGCTPVVVDTAGSHGEPHILLGRDVLNHFRITLDGPNAKLEIG
ncbi:MAG: retropepsin-like domain-containing protein [Planctomycetes bacterium]|nr:retropepsin-like domain-containing protein [Planctomycetota bacterium]